MSQAVANQYAKALLEVVSRPGAAVGPEQALSQMQSFAALVSESPELRTVLLSPAVPHGSKEKAVRKLAGMAGLSELIASFLLVVIRHRRLVLFGGIRERFQALIDESLGLQRALVESAGELSPSERAALEAALVKRTGKQVRGVYATDKSLIGGVTVRLGSKVYDASVRGHIEELRRQLAGKA
jgi:F-type H+-transporting ATPase subunit delta